MTKLLFMLLFCLVPLEARKYTRYNPTDCPDPHLQNGIVRVQGRSHVARYTCKPQFRMVGNRYATCRGKEWDEPAPICVRSGCRELSLDKIIAIPSHGDAWYIFFCFPGQKLVGSPALYCDGSKWNGTEPTCVREVTQEQLSCDFESPDLCGWRQDEMHDFDWLRLNTKTPSAFAFTGPSFDHTLGQGAAGYYMYIESSSRVNNDSARLISPVFSGNLTSNGCFSFFYHMYGKAIGGFRVYQIPENSHHLIVNLTDFEQQQYLLFEKWGNQGDTWFRNVSKLSNTSSDFQIMIEGIRGASFTSDIAIDDVAILQGDQCDEATTTAVTPSEPPDSCANNRCDLLGNSTNERGCGCTVSCITDQNCCPDFFDICVYNIASTSESDEDPTDVPRTEKLIGSPNTTSKPSIPFKTNTQPPSTPNPKPPVPKITTPTATKGVVNNANTIRPPTIKPRVNNETATKNVSTNVATKAPTMARKATAKPNKTVLATTKKVAPLKPTVETPKVTMKSKKSDADKTRKEEPAKSFKATHIKPEVSSSTAAVVTMLALAACLAAAALVALRSARGRAALARLRARAESDPEVRYLTRADD